MSGQSLREALEQKIGAWKHERGDLYHASQELAGLLTAHPEPAPEQPWLMIHHLRVVREAGYIVTVPGDAPLPRRVVDREALAIALHDSVCPDRRCEPTVMGQYFAQADAVLARLPTEGLTPTDAVPDVTCKHPLGFTVLRMERMCCSDCGTPSPGRCVCGALYGTPQCQSRAHLHGPVLAGGAS